MASSTATLQDDVIEGLALHEQFERIGGNLRPEQVSAILMEADSGRPARFVDLMHESRQKDGHLHSVLQASETAITALEWALAVRGNVPKRKAKKAAEECTEALKECDTLSLGVAHLAGEGPLFGYAYDQVIWHKVDGGHLWPQEFKPVSCRRFAFTREGELRFIQSPYASPDTSGVDLMEAYRPGKFLCYKPRVNGDVLPREGLARLLVWFALFRNWDLRDWFQMAELAWKPKRRAEYDKAEWASKEDKRALKTILERWHSTGIAIHPNTVKLFMEAAKGVTGTVGSSHNELAKFCGYEMSKAVLGITDATESDATGARAATESRQELRKELRDARAMGIARVIYRQLIVPFVEINYGITVPAPSFDFLTEERAELKSFSESMEILAKKAGYPIPFAYIEDQTGIPQAKEGEPQIGPDPKEETDDGTGEPGTGEGKPDDDGSENSE